MKLTNSLYETSPITSDCQLIVESVLVVVAERLVIIQNATFISDFDEIRLIRHVLYESGRKNVDGPMNRDIKR